MGRPGKQELIPYVDFDRLANPRIQRLEGQLTQARELSRTARAEAKRLRGENRALEEKLRVAQETNARLREKLRKLDYVRVHLEGGEEACQS